MVIPPTGPLAGEIKAAPPARRWQAGTLVYSRAGLIALFCWLLLGDFAWSMKERASAPVLQLLLKRFHASDTVTGLLLGSLPQLVAVLLVPVISYRSDRHRGRWGRRIPFLLVPVPLAALSMAGLAIGPLLGGYLHHALGARSPGLAPLVLLVLGLFWTVFEFSTITVDVLFAGLVNDVVPRALLGRFYGLFRGLSLVAGIIFFFWIFVAADYFRIFLGIGIFYGVGVTLMCLKVKEGEYEPPPQPTTDGGDRSPLLDGARTYIRECFTHPYYLFLFATCSLAAMASTLCNLFNLYFAGSVGMDNGTYGKCIALTYVISLSLSYFQGELADRFHPLRVGLVSVALYAMITLWGGFFVNDASSFAVALVAQGVISGAWFTVTASLRQRLLPESKFAQFASAQFIITSISNALVSALMGTVLDYNHHLYRYTYLVASVLSVMALLAGLVLHRKFMALGGPKNYLAPE